jgi:probable phosphoglycerate mutase
MEEGGKAFLKEYGLSPAEGGYNRDRDLSGQGDVALFCHQGAGLSFMAWLLGISPPVFWRSAYIAPSSLSVILVEQAEEAYASMRLLKMGDVSHLYKAGTPDCPSGLLYNNE